MPRDVGIELEVCSDGPKVAQELHRLGLTLLPDVHEYHCGRGNACMMCSNGWKCQYDGSLANGCEIISPPIFIDNLLVGTELDTIETVLLTSQIEINHHAGMHVHVSAAEFEYEDFGALHENFAKAEEAIFFLATGGFEEHRGLDYTRPIGMLEKTLQMHPETGQSKRAKGRAAVAQHQNTRYNALSFSPHMRFHTVEWRVFNSTRASWRMKLNAATAAYFTELSKRGYEIASLEGLPPQEQKERLLEFMLQMGEDLFPDYQEWYECQMFNKPHRNPRTGDLEEGHTNKDWLRLRGLTSLYSEYDEHGLTDIDYDEDQPHDLTETIYYHTSDWDGNTACGNVGCHVCNLYIEDDCQCLDCREDFVRLEPAPGLCNHTDYDIYRDTDDRARCDNCDFLV